MTIDDPEVLLAYLDTDEARVLRFRAGLIDGCQHSTSEIAGFLGVSRAHARALEHAAWQKLLDLAQHGAASTEAVSLMARRCRVTWRRSPGAQPN